MFDKAYSDLINSRYLMIIHFEYDGNRPLEEGDEAPELTRKLIKELRPFDEMFPELYRAMQLPYCYMNGKIRFKGRSFAPKRIVKPHGRKPRNFLYAKP